MVTGVDVAGDLVDVAVCTVVAGRVDVVGRVHVVGRAFAGQVDVVGRVDVADRVDALGELTVREGRRCWGC